MFCSLFGISEPTGFCQDGYYCPSGATTPNATGHGVNDIFQHNNGCGRRRLEVPPLIVYINRRVTREDCKKSKSFQYEANSVSIRPFKAMEGSGTMN